MQMHLHHGLDVAEAASLAGGLPRRATPRQFVGLEEALELEAPDNDDPFAENERTRTSEELQVLVERAIQSLSAEDRLILRMRFEDAMPVSSIARALQLDQKRLYRMIQRILKDVRAALGEIVPCEQASGGMRLH
jgi:RNA polymerase sigma factor (sigma-70 family)